MFRAGFAVLMSAGAVLMLAGCAGGAGGRPSDVSTMQCGDQRVTLGMLDDTLQLTVGEARFALRPAEAASGAKYEAVGDPSTTFWSKGDRAMLVVKGQNYPECVRTGAAAPASRANGNDPARLQGGEWVVEDIDGTGIVDRSRATLNFGADGGLSGRGSCNQYSGRYTLTDDRLGVSGQVASTMMACAPALMEQESRFFAILSRVERFRFSLDGALILETGDGRTIKARRN